MMHESVTSPLSSRRGQSLYEKMNDLSAEISEGIVNLSDGKRWLIESELNRLKEESQRETSPEATYNLLLFRRYSDIANQIKDQVTELQSQSSFPSILPEAGNDSSLLRGFDAVKSNIFWLRVVAALFSFISFVVMATVPHVDRAHYLPGSYFEVRSRRFFFNIPHVLPPPNKHLQCTSFLPRMLFLITFEFYCMF